MPTNIKLNPSNQIVSRLGLEAGGKVQKFFTNTCYKRMDKYVPRRNDNLRLHVALQPDSITYQSPYAHAQYIGFTKGPVVNYTTPGTGPYWDKRMVSAEIGEVIEEVENYIKRGGIE